ncbi:MAG: DUF5666 domain-containing protein [Pseudomonadota bacterium]
MQTIPKTLCRVTPLLCSMTLVACGGGTSDPPPPVDNGPVQGIDRTGLRSFGTVNRFSSVVVDGTVFETSNATITVDEIAATEADLQVGDVVVVIGEIDTDGNASALSIESDDLLRGPISAIDIVAETITVLEQTVEVSVDTALDDDLGVASIEQLVMGSNVAISGFIKSDGIVLATRIDSDNGNDLQAVGRVSSADQATMVFSIGPLVVDFSAATLIDFDGEMPTADDIVEVEGDSRDGNGVLRATEVTRAPERIGGDDGDSIEIEGIVTAAPSNGSFSTNGITVRFDNETTFVGGTSAELIVGSDVDIDAVVGADELPLATTIAFQQAGEVRLEGDADAVDLTASTVSVLGVTVSISGETVVEDDSDLDDRDFSIAGISVGDFLEIGARETGTSSASAELIKRDDDDSDGEALVRARIDSTSRPDLVALGITIRTDANTEFEADDEDELDATAFFAAATNGRLISVEGIWDGNVLIAESVELEDE